jgi:hypothetical protein
VSDLYLQLLFYGLAAAAVAPLALVIAALIVSRSERPITSTLVFSAGAALLAGAVATLELVILAESDIREGGTFGALIDLAIGGLFLVLGLAAVRSRPTAERDAARRAQAERAASGGSRAMFITGLLAQLLNIDSLAVMSGGLKEIGEAGVSASAALAGAAFLIGVTLLPYYGPGLLHILAPGHTTRLLGRLTEWILRNSRRVEIVTGLLIGTIFTVKGLQSLF